MNALFAAPKRLWDWLWDEDYMVFVIIGGFLVVVIAAAVYLANKDAEQWALYSAEHRCEKTEYIPGDAILTTLINPSNGQVSVATTTTSSKTRWQCDNGVVWR